jgi:hypothetical protein
MDRDRDRDRDKDKGVGNGMDNGYYGYFNDFNERLGAEIVCRCRCAECD